MARVDRLKRRLLAELVDQNLELVRGLPQRHLKRRRRFRLGGSLLGLTLLPMALLGSSRLFAPAFAPAPAAPHPAPPASLRSAPQRIDPAVLPLAVRRVVVDAGHGGDAVGTRSPSGLVEKDITLDIAKRLARHLSQASFEVILTRQQDAAISLRDRARIANEARADLFLSIHLNWIADGDSRGVETYFLGPTDDPAIGRLAALENRESGYSVADFRRLLDGIYADAREGSSRRFAESVNGALHQALVRVDRRIGNRGVKSAPFVVLVSTEMPAVLAEVSCLSNPEEADLLAKPLYREYIAEALARGVRRYALAAENAPEKGI